MLAYIIAEYWPSFVHWYIGQKPVSRCLLFSPLPVLQKEFFLLPLTSSNVVVWKTTCTERHQSCCKVIAETLTTEIGHKLSLIGNNVSIIGTG